MKPIADFDRLDQLLREAIDLSASERRSFVVNLKAVDSELADRLAVLLEASETSDELRTGGVANRRGFQELAESAEMSAAKQEPLVPSSMVGAYRIVSPLGQGGMATVYLAERADGEFSQQVALKVMDQDGLGNWRFNQEREILAQLTHPGIARILDGGVTPGNQPWFAMDLVEGEPIDRYCEEHGSSIEERVRLILQVLEAVAAAHNKLIVHRDLKPSNILVTAGGEVKLLDFGIAKSLEESGAAVPTEATATMLRVLTPQWASPEQVFGTPVTAATDIFQVGALLYLLLTNEHAFEFDSSSLLDMERALENEPRAPSSRPSFDRGPGFRRKRLAQDLDAIVLNALKRDPADRYQSANALQADLRGALQGLPLSARRATPASRAASWMRRHRLAAVAAAALVVYALTATWSALQIARERDTAQRAASRAEATVDFVTSLFEEASPRRSGRSNVSAHDLLLTAPSRIDAELAGQEDLKSDLYRLTGSLMRTAGDEIGAEPMFRKAVDLAEQSEEGGSLVALQKARLRLAGVLASQNNENEANLLLEEVRVALSRVAPNLRQPLEISYLAERAGLLREVGKRGEARELYAEAVQVAERVEPPNPRQIARLRGQWANLVRFDPDSPDHGSAALEASLEEHRAVFGPRHPDVAMVLKNLSAALGTYGQRTREKDPEQGDAILERVRELLGESKQIAQDYYGEVHPEVGRTHFLLSALAFVEGRWPALEAESMAAYEIFEELDGFDRMAATSLTYVGAAQREQGDHKKAISTLRAALQMSENATHSDHHQVALPLYQIGETYYLSNDCDLAIPALERGLTILLDTRGPGASLTEDTQTVLFDCRLKKAQAFIDGGRLGEARQEAAAARRLLNAAVHDEPLRTQQLDDFEETLG